METASLKVLLMKKGATLVGVGDITEALSADILHLKRAVAIAVNRSLSGQTVSHLTALQRETERWLKARGFRFLSIPPDSDRKGGKFISRLYQLFSHKTAATCAGLGWIGKNGLIINETYGPRLSWASVLTDAPLYADAPRTVSLCGDCDLCVKYCPSGAISGRHWVINKPFAKFVSYEKCRALKGKRPRFDEKPNCGLCVTICPYARLNKGGFAPLTPTRGRLPLDPSLKDGGLGASRPPAGFRGGAPTK
jgi:epoxyqueuosine reductase